ncbi:MAG: hypothetical protein AB1640_15600, partial [bacterium]
NQSPRLLPDFENLALRGWGEMARCKARDHSAGRGIGRIIRQEDAPAGRAPETAREILRNEAYKEVRRSGPGFRRGRLPQDLHAA